MREVTRVHWQCNVHLKTAVQEAGFYIIRISSGVRQLHHQMETTDQLLPLRLVVILSQGSIHAYLPFSEHSCGALDLTTSSA